MISNLLFAKLQCLEKYQTWTAVLALLAAIILTIAGMLLLTPVSPQTLYQSLTLMDLHVTASVNQIKNALIFQIINARLHPLGRFRMQTQVYVLKNVVIPRNATTLILFVKQQQKDKFQMDKEMPVVLSVLLQHFAMIPLVLFARLHPSQCFPIMTEESASRNARRSPVAIILQPMFVKLLL
jgi:hypothetical protein